MYASSGRSRLSLDIFLYSILLILNIAQTLVQIVVRPTSLIFSCYL